MIYTNAINGVPFNSEAYVRFKNLLATCVPQSCPIYYPQDDVYPIGYDDYGNYLNNTTYGREESWMRRCLGEGNESNVPGAGMALALAGCIGEVITPAEKFPYLSSLSTLRDIANCEEARAELLKNKKTFRLLCMSEYLRTYFNIPISIHNMDTGPSHQATFQIITTVDKPFIYIYLNGFEPTGGVYSKVNLRSGGVTRNIWTSPIPGESGRGAEDRWMQVHLVVDPVADYNLGRTVTVEYIYIATSTNYRCPIYYAS